MLKGVDTWNHGGRWNATAQTLRPEITPRPSARLNSEGPDAIKLHLIMQDYGK
jgi:hypothetical protein